MATFILTENGFSETNSLNIFTNCYGELIIKLGEDGESDSPFISLSVQEANSLIINLDYEIKRYIKALKNVR